MRTSHRCTKCDHDEVLYVPALRDSNYDQMSVDTRLGLFSKETIGAFAAYLCCRCGYAELYVKDAAALDPAHIQGARLLKAPAPKAYR